MTRRQALAVATLTVAALAWSLTAASSKNAGPIYTNTGDMPLFRSILDRVRTGEDYYDAAYQEMRSRNYPTGSMFNWRSPALYSWLLGSLPNLNWGHALLVAGAAAALLLAYRALSSQGGRWMAVAIFVLLVGAFLPVFTGLALLPEMYPLFVYTELWSGLLIALSVCAYGNGRWGLATAAGLLALFIRELALPYCLVSLALASWRKRWSETSVWLAGLLLFGLFLSIHAQEISLRVTGSDYAFAEGWVQFGGMRFLLTTARMHGFLALLPLWVTAICLPLALFGLGAWQGPMSVRVGLTTALYVAAFMVVGKAFNPYWGLLYVPLLSFGWVWFPVGLRDLILVMLRRT
jgi:hypothetical protein